MKNNAFLSYRIKPEEFDKNVKEFKKLSFEDQKKLLIETLDKNQLYVNFSEIDDVENNVSEEDKSINKSFYGVI
jgi:adenine-specific DNA-methyltransferase